MLICLAGVQISAGVNWFGEEIDVIRGMSCEDANWTELVQIHV
jgi:hypothetical protein